MLSPLRRLREEFKISQIEFAAVSHVSQSKLSRIENGKEDICKKLEDYLRTLSVDVEEFRRRQRQFMEEVKQGLETDLKRRIMNERASDPEGG